MDKEISNKKLKVNKLSMTSSLESLMKNRFTLNLKILSSSKSNFVDEYEIPTNTIDNVFKDINLKHCLKLMWKDLN